MHNTCTNTIGKPLVFPKEKNRLFYIYQSTLSSFPCFHTANSMRHNPAIFKQMHREQRNQFVFVNISLLIKFNWYRYDCYDFTNVLFVASFGCGTQCYGPYSFNVSHGDCDFLFRSMMYTFNILVLSTFDSMSCFICDVPILLLHVLYVLNYIVNKDTHFKTR